ncbi:hypothetical protein [Paracoccus aminovorans]|jgi:hypothetical protein|nr:hypothetical protein [Paracoccus aminovorans]
MLAAIDDFRRQQEDLPSRPEVVRRVMSEWLKKTQSDSQTDV